MKQAEDDPRNITESPNESAFQMEVIADVYQYQQQTQQQSQRNIQSTQTRPCSSAERQRKYREKRKADKMNACTSFSQSSDVQPQQEQPQHDVQINKRQPQSNAERQRKYRKLLRKQQLQQQQMEDINAITVLSNKPHTSSIHQLQNIEQAEHARKRHLNKQRQSRFRARQRFESPSTSSHEAQAERLTYKTEDAKLRELYQKDCAQDYTDCCKNKNKRKETKKKESEHQTRKHAAATSIISKIPSTIQVKKFASINADDTPKPEKKTSKRPVSPKNTGFFIKNPISIAPGPRLINPVSLPPPMKKLKMSSTPVINTIRFVNEPRPMATYTRIKPRTSMPMISNFNGLSNSRPFNNVNMVANDNINLSLDNLTQGLDIATMAAMSSDNSQNDDVVCTPDFPMEPLCEVTEDNDDDVQCISPDPVVNYNKNSNPPPLVPRSGTLPDLSSDSIIQMTENDVTVNLITGGLKFRVDPQTLSSNKMYRLPDGRVFAIKSNPNMPGGYSATIVAVTENAKASNTQGTTYAAKISAISNVNSSTPVITKSRNQSRTTNTKRNNSLPKQKISTATDNMMSRECDLSVPVEWYRYNLIDAVDALEYSLSRLNKLKKEATTMFLRTRNINEMRNLHRTLERLLNTSSKRFHEIRENLNRELKQYISKKKGEHISDDDDDVEILPDLENDDPIFIDENSLDSNVNVNESQEVDLTGTGNSEQNDSGEKVDSSRIETDLLCEGDNSTILNSSDELQLSMSCNSNGKKRLNEVKIGKVENVTKQTDINDITDILQNKTTDISNTELVCDESLKADITENQLIVDKEFSKEKDGPNDIKQHSNEKEASDDVKQNFNEKQVSDNVQKDSSNDENCSVEQKKQALDDIKQEPNEVSDDNNKQNNSKGKDHNNDKKIKDSDISSELIENLLKDDNEVDTEHVPHCLDIPDLQNT